MVLELLAMETTMAMDLVVAKPMEETKETEMEDSMEEMEIQLLEVTTEMEETGIKDSVAATAMEEVMEIQVSVATTAMEDLMVAMEIKDLVVTMATEDSMVAMEIQDLEAAMAMEASMAETVLVTRLDVEAVSSVALKALFRIRESMLLRL